MLDKFIYENHLGQRFNGLENGVYLNYNELRDYSWSYDIINNRISRFYHGIRGRKIPLVISCKSDAEAIAVKHQLLQLTETDIGALQPGKVYIGDYYTNGYITDSVKSEYLINKRYCKLELTLTSDNPIWYREKTHTFVQNRIDITTTQNGIDYPHDYAYDYALKQIGSAITCDSIGSNAFKLLIYGATENPTITIGANTYRIDGKIDPGETLLIDSLKKTITLTTSTGAKVNWFDKRSRDNYIFESIPSGQSIITWNGSFGFDLTIIEKRSEPRWT